MPAPCDEEEGGPVNTYAPFHLPVQLRPVLAERCVLPLLFLFLFLSLDTSLSRQSIDVKNRHYESSIFCIPPFLGPLLFDNTDSDARDHCANERSSFPFSHCLTFPNLS
jgi:hypothetical protein